MIARGINYYYFMQIPGIIFFINNDISTETQTNLQSQLYIDEVITDTEFNARITADPNYPIIIHFNNLRILVLESPYDTNPSNKEFANIALFFKNGMLYVLDHHYGFPTISINAQNINLFNLKNIIKEIHFEKFNCRKCHCGCSCNCFKHLPIQLQRLLLAPWDPSGVHSANCDNEFNNKAFIERK